MEEIKRRRLGADAWRALLARHAESGLSVKEFCEHQTISPASFYQWRSKLGITASEAPSAPAADESLTTAGFVDLGTLSARASRLELRLDLGGGVVLHLARG
ncbi:MAG TPA: transposase [Nitrospiraceae bacterium]|nr:transposase [Nitrospiraceae bacterium]